MSNRLVTSAEFCDCDSDTLRFYILRNLTRYRRLPKSKFVEIFLAVSTKDACKKLEIKEHISETIVGGNE